MRRFDDDEHDGILFRFWIRAASQWSGDTARALLACRDAADYREALVGLAGAKGVNLPAKGDEPLSRALEIVLSRCAVDSETARILRTHLTFARAKEETEVGNG